MNTMEQVGIVGAAEESQQSPLYWAEFAAAAVILGQPKKTNDADESFWVLSAEDALAARRIFWEAE